MTGGTAVDRHAAFLLAGLLATSAQVLLLRELVVDVAGDEAAIGVGLAAWLFGIAVGAAAARRRTAAADAREAVLGLALLAVLPPLTLMAGRSLCGALLPGGGELPGLGVTILLALATLLPCGAAVGWVFTMLASVASRTWRGGEAVARLYVVESMGSLLGGVAVTLLAGRVLSLRLAALFGLLAALVASKSTLAGPGLPRGRSPRKALVAAAIVCILVAAAAGPLDAASERARFASLAPGVPFLASADTPYQHLALGGGEVRHLYASGQYAASFPDPYTAEGLGHLVALLTERPARLLMLGGVERGLVSVLLRHPVVRLTLVVPDRREVDFLRPWLPAPERAALEDPRVRLVHDDPRRFLSSRTPDRFDLVLLLGPEPATLLRARLATVESFRDAARHLAPEGVLVVSLPASPTVLAGESEALAAALVRSLRDALPVVRITPPELALAVAGHDPEAVTLDASVLAARWRARAVASTSFDAALLPALLPAERVAEHEASLLAAAERAAPSRDDRPVSFLHALVRRQRLVSGSPSPIVRAAVAVPPWSLVALAFVPSLIVALRVAVRRRAALPLLASHGVAVAGAAGLGFSLLALFSFQTHAGALYGQLGALVAVFMLGLALGGTASGIAAARDPARAARRRLGLCLAAATLFGVALASALPAAGRWSYAGSLAALLGHGAILLLAGAVTGAVFPAAVEVRLGEGEAAGAAAGRLEAADHVGAALAALSGAVVFVPLLGLARSALVLAGLLAVALGMLLCVPRDGLHSKECPPKASG